MVIDKSIDTPLELELELEQKMSRKDTLAKTVKQVNPLADAEKLPLNKVGAVPAGDLKAAKLRQALLDEKEEGESDLLQAAEEAVPGTEAGNMASDAPLHLAEAGAVVSDAPAAGAGSVPASAGGTAAGTTAGTAAVAAGTTFGYGGLIALGVVGVAAAAASNSGSKDSTPPADTTPPAAPTFALASDTGASNSDGITSNGLINVSGLESGATWQYSTNGGTSWSTGTGSSFTLAAGTYAAGAVQVKQTDAAGNPGTATSSPGSITVDSTAPVIQSMAAHSVTKTVELTYDGPLDAANLPVAGNFSITTIDLANPGGIANPVASVAISLTSASTLVLTLTNAFTAGNVTVTYTDPTAGNDVKATQDVAGNDAAGFSSGVVADGYIRGAQIYIDTDKDGIADAAELQVGVVTDANGNFFLPAGAPSGTIIAVGGVNIDTGIPNTIPLKAPAGSTTVNPLTTLVQAVIDANPTIAVATASASVVSALGLTVGTDLTTFDPLSGNDLAARKAAAAVAAVLTLAEGTSAGAATTVASNLATQIQTASGGNTTIDLADNATITSALTGSGAAAAAGAITNATTAINTAATSDAVVTAQSQHLDTITPAAPTAAPDLTAASDSGTSSTDNLTNATTPVVRVSFNNSALDGTAAVEDDVITIWDGATQVSAAATLTADDIALGYKDITTNALVAGTYNLSAKITDQAGHTSTATSALAVTVDITAPTLTITSDDAALNIGDTATITFTFTEDPGTTFAWDGTAGDVTVTGGTLGAISGSGLTRTATFTPDNGVAAGNASITVAAGSYTDAAGNNGGAGTTPAIAIDTLAPTVTIISDDAALNIGDTATITITFSEEPTGFAAGDITTTGGSLSGLTVNPNDAKVYTATFTPDNAVAAGSASITIAAGSYTDAAGNNGDAGTTPAITIDTLAPTVTITSDDGALNIGDTATITFTFSEVPTGFAAGDITTTGGTLSGLAVSPTDAKVYTATLTPDAGFEGNASITVAADSYTDAAGNNGGAGTTPAVSIDTLAPTIAIVATADDNIINATEALGAVTVAGTTTGVADGRTVTVHLNGHEYTTTVTANAWTATVPLIDVGALADKATYPVTADVSDAAGNAATQASQNVQVFTTGPAVTITPITGDNLINAQEHGAGITIAGTTSGAEDTSAVRVTLNGLDYDTTVTSNAWSVNVDATAVGNLLNGQGYPVAVSVTSASGPGSQSQTLQIDTTAPSAPVITGYTPDTGVPGDNLTNNTQPTFSGTAEANATVNLTITKDSNAFATPTVTADAQGAWTFQPGTALVDGVYAMTATATDAAGNTGVASGATTLTIDQSAPAAPIITGYTTDTGVPGDNITSNTQPTFSGTAAANATVNLTITKDGNAFATPSVTADAQGAWTFQPGTALVDGVYAMTATATDAAGNTGVASGATTLTIDQTAPAAPITTGYSPDTGVQGDGITSNTQPTFSGTAEANATVNLTITKDGNPFATDTVTASPQGAWSIQAPIALADGVYALTATATDAAGNTGASSGATTATVDHTAPTLVSFGTSTADGSYNADDTIALTAIMSEAVRSGSTFVATLDGGGTATMTAAADGTTLTGSYVIGANQNSADLSVASYTAGSVQDLADNAMTATTLPTGANNLADGHAIVVDTISPSFTSAATTSFANNGTGPVYRAAATDASNAVTYSLTGTDAGLFQINGQTGVITFLTPPSSAGTNNITVVATDLAGNATSLPVAVSVVNAPSLSSSLDGIANFEVTSNIVLTVSENVTAVADKYIHIVNDGGAGFHGENTVNTLDILVTNTNLVSIVNNTITINPQFDLDFNNDYHITVDPGAFVGVGSGLASVAITDPTAVNFSTVNPSATATATASQAMNSGTDAMVAGHMWWDAEGNGAPGGTPVARDFTDGNYAITANDLASTGIQTNDFYISVNNFGVGDLIYVDNHGDNTIQRQGDFDAGLITDLGVPPTQVITGASGTATGNNGGQFDVYLAGLPDSTFADTTALQTLLNVSYQPILYG